MKTTKQELQQIIEEEILNVLTGEQISEISKATKFAPSGWKGVLSLAEKNLALIRSLIDQFRDDAPRVIIQIAQNNESIVGQL